MLILILALLLGSTVAMFGNAQRTIHDQQCQIHALNIQLAHLNMEIASLLNGQPDATQVYHRMPALEEIFTRSRKEIQ